MQFAILTISDSRTEQTDTSGQLIQEALTAAGLTCLARKIVADDRVQIQAAYLQLELQGPDLIITNGGTGLACRDVTIAALTPLFSVTSPGFGEAFRQLSWVEIGPRALASQALCGFNYSNQLTYCLPGSKNAVQVALTKLILPDFKHLLFERSEQRKEVHHHVN